MKKLIALSIVTLSLFGAGVSKAGPVFDVTAMTLLARNNSGLTTFQPTDVLLGSIALTDAAGMRIMMGAPTEFGAADIASFSFMVGNLTLSSMGATGIDFRAILGPDGSTFSLFRLLFNTPMGVGGCDVLCITEFGRFATARDRVNVQFRTTAGAPMDGVSIDLFGAKFAVTRRQVAEPAELGLLAFGLLSAAALRRRRSS